VTDSIASLRQWAVVFAAGGFTATIPPRPASDWIELVRSGDLMMMLMDADAERLADALVEEKVSEEELQRAIADAVSEAAGREWQIAARTVFLLDDDQARGELILRLGNFDRIAFGALLDATYALYVRWMKKEDRENFDASLNAEPLARPGESSDPREQAKRMRRMTRERGGATGGPSSDERPRSPQPPESRRQDA
jgi:hypothetical protein